MGFFSDFFSPGKTESKPEKVSIQTPEQEELLKNMLAQFGKAAGGPTDRAPQMFSPQNQTEKQMSQWAKSQAVRDMLAGKVPYEVGPKYAEKFYEESIRPGMLAEWEDVAKPQIRESFAGPGYWGTSRMRAESEGAEQLSRDMSSARSGLMYSEEIARRQAAESAMGRVGPTAEMVNKQGAIERDIEHEKLMDSITRYLSGEMVDGQYNPANNPNVQIALSLLGIQPYVVGTTSESTGAGLGYGILDTAGEKVTEGLLGKIF